MTLIPPDNLPGEGCYKEIDGVLCVLAMDYDGQEIWVAVDEYNDMINELDEETERLKKQHEEKFRSHKRGYRR